MWKAYLEDTLETPVAFVNGREGGKVLARPPVSPSRAAPSPTPRPRDTAPFPRSSRLVELCRKQFTVGLERRVRRWPALGRA